MKLHDLKPNHRSKTSKIRRGRGNASGYGTFSGRGCKGQNSRTGGGVRLGFEGGQTSLLQRIPKRRGFTNPNRKEYIAVNLDTLEAIFSDKDTVSVESLTEKNVIQNKDILVKILSRGELSKKITIKNLPVSAAAAKKIEKAGGKVEGMKTAEKPGTKDTKKAEG